MVDYLGQGISVSVLEPEKSGRTFSGLFLQAAVSMTTSFWYNRTLRIDEQPVIPVYGSCQITVQLVFSMIWLSMLVDCAHTQMYCTVYAYVVLYMLMYMLSHEYLYMHICLWYMHVLRLYHSWFSATLIRFYGLSRIAGDSLSSMALPPALQWLV